jgi:PAS domain S-box-containing protein
LRFRPASVDRLIAATAKVGGVSADNKGFHHVFLYPRHPLAGNRRGRLRRLLRPTVLLLVGLVALTARGADSPAPLLTAETVRQAQASTAAIPVRLRGVVTFAHPSDPLLFLHDGTGQVAVELSNNDAPRPHPGDVLTLSGQVAPGSRQPRVQAGSLVLAGNAPLPFAPEITYAQALDAERENQWVRLRGRLLRNESFRDWQRLTLGTPQGEFSVSITSATRLDAPGGADLEVRGVCRLWTTAGTSDIGGFFLFTPSLAEVRLLAADTAPTTGSLTRIEQVRRLPTGPAGAGHPVELRGVVTFTHHDSRIFYLHDASGGVLVWPEAGDAPLPAVGATVTVQGYTSTGTPAIGIRAVRIEGTGTQPLPAPRPISLTDALAGAEDAQWVEMRGRLRQIDSLGSWLRLFLTTAAGEITVSIPQSAPPAAETGSFLAVRGVCQSWIDQDNRIGGFFLYTPSTAELTIVAPPPPDPFAVPEESIANLGRYRPETLEMQQVRLRGTVLLHRPGHSVVLQNDTGVVRAFGSSPDPFQPGDQIEVAGVPGRLGPRAVLRGAVFRRLDPGPAPVPQRLPARPRTDVALDERLVALSGRLTNLTVRRGDTRLLLDAGGVPVEVVFPGALPIVSADRLRLGARLGITGLYLLEYDQDDEPTSFSVQLRAPDDLVVEAQPPWWTTRRALTALAAIGLCLGAGLVWAVVLRSQLRRQTAVVREQLAQQAALDARHREIVENASDFIFSTDLAGRVLSCNPAGERLTGRCATEPLTLGELLATPEAVALFLDSARQPIAAPASHFEARLRAATGTLIPVEISARAIREDGRVTGLLGIARDITARKQMEELHRQLQTAESLGRMAAAIAHHFNNQIQTVLMGLEMVRLEIPHSPSSHEILVAAERSARQAAEIGSLMLTYLGQSAGKREALDLAAACRPAVAQCRARLPAGATLADELPEAGPRIAADAAQIRRALLCLLANAEEALPSDGGEIRVSVGTISGESIPTTHRVPLDFAPLVPTYACMSVADNGAGIGEHDLERIFDPFFTTKFHGRGTGLAIVLGIARAHNGAVVVESLPGAGSRFRLFLPLHDAARG